jgi:hypothetical protein
MREIADLQISWIPWRRVKVRSFGGCKFRPATVVPAGRNWDSGEGDEAAAASGVEGYRCDLASMQAVTCMSAEQGEGYQDALHDDERAGGGYCCKANVPRNLHAASLLGLANAFYEWQRIDIRERRAFAFAKKRGEPYALSGHWES